MLMESHIKTGIPNNMINGRKEILTIKQNIKTLKLTSSLQTHIFNTYSNIDSVYSVYVRPHESIP